MSGDAGGARSHRRGPDLADRSRQPRHGGAHACCGRLQRAGRGRHQAQADRRAAGHEPGRRYGPADRDRGAGQGDTRRGAIDVVADRGYFKIEDIEACEKAGMEPYVPRPQRGPRSGRGCSARTSSNTTRRATLLSARPASACSPIRHRSCAGSRKSTTSTSRPVEIARCARDARTTVRSVSRLENEAVLDRMQARLAKRPEILDRRRESWSIRSAPSNNG